MVHKQRSENLSHGVRQAGKLCQTVLGVKFYLNYFILYSFILLPTVVIKRGYLASNQQMLLVQALLNRY